MIYIISFIMYVAHSKLSCICRTNILCLFPYTLIAISGRRHIKKITRYFKDIFSQKHTVKVLSNYDRGRLEGTR